ncbi:HD-GYP domain-containing protein [Meiothermus rufus]|uniref:HD-GYP domain-containing protein n=1 Tax=Meiothermus rufus TaxID=604332 RepID=UPI000424B800|nr:HD domain-containing phosphohydrolase [Meiothermus rufus]
MKPLALPSTPGGWAGLTPYRRFLVSLGLWIGLAALGLVACINSMIGRFLVSNTAEVTEAAVEKHLHLILPNLFDPSVTGSHPTESNHAAHPPASEPTSDPYGSLLSGDALHAIVRLHFDLYNITDATFYTPNGQITYAYQREREGQRASGVELEYLHQVIQRGPIIQAKNQRVKLWFSIRSQSDPHQIEGLVSIERDLRPEWAAVRRIEMATVLGSSLVALVLFLALRGVYLRSSRKLEDKNRKLEALLEALEQSYDDLLRALSNALDSRDNETADHTERVARYALRLGRELGLSEEALAVLRHGALLHDVGKIGVPDAVLLKPSKLNEQELRQMRSHVELGDAILSGIAFLEQARQVVRHHHERWDGTGYPDGLRGEEIPLLARIFSLCDTYDAMTSNRPYTKARSDAEARAEILSQSGRQFDPKVVSAFLRIPPEEWLEIGWGSTTEDSRSKEAKKT